MKHRNLSSISFVSIYDQPLRKYVGLHKTLNSNRRQSDMQPDLTIAEENYLKVIFHLSGKDQKKVSTNMLADKLETKASSITDMLKKLSDKELIHYEKYRGCQLTENGERIAIHIIRKHRLWETFLVSKLGFGWDEVHDVAEQLEHIRSVKLIDRIDQFLNYPKYDPHGDPIPDKDGKITYRKSKIPLAESVPNSVVEVLSVNEDSLSLLSYLDEIGLQLGTRIKVLEKFDFDDSMKIELEDQTQINLSKKVTQNINVQFVEEV